MLVNQPAASGDAMQWQRILHSHDVEEMRMFLRVGYGSDIQFDPTHRKDGPIDIRLEGVNLPNLFILHVRSITETTIEGTRPDYNYVLFLPVRGRVEAGSGRSNFVCSPRRAVVMSRPTSPKTLLRNETDAAALSVRFPQSAIARQLTGLLGEPVAALPEFSAPVDLAEGYGRSLAQYLLLAVSDFKRAGGPGWNPITICAFEDFMLSKLLLSHPHSHSEALRRAARPITPRDVKYAVEYMHARLGSPITIADIAEASGIAGRTLFKHFQDCHGISPMRYMRDARFQKARDALMRADPGESVTAIAMNWGFSHMGRFSVEYRRRFGESPSDTLRRRRRIRLTQIN
jgi:AraC-like DNA-binding protein